jgi:hypothetical protein
MDSLMDTRDDWRWCKWYEADCIRRINTDKMTNQVLGDSATKWMSDWTLYGRIHLHKLVTGQVDTLPCDWTDWYKNSWDRYLHTDPECVRMKEIFDLFGIGNN